MGCGSSKGVNKSGKIDTMEDGDSVETVDDPALGCKSHGNDNDSGIDVVTADSSILTAAKPPHFLTRRSIRRSQESLRLSATSEMSVDFNQDVTESVAIDSNDIEWHRGPHCMNCYLGQKHECWDPQYAKDMNNILRRVFFIKNAGGSFELNTKRTGEGDDYATITYCVRYAPNTKELPHHTHPHGEEYFVLRGSFDDHSSIGYMAAPAMTYVKYPHGTEHHAQPNIDEGCDVLTWWGQNCNEEAGHELSWWKTSDPKTTAQTVQSVNTVFVPPDSPGSAWRRANHGFGFEMILFESTGPSKEKTWMLHLPETKLPLKEYEQLENSETSCAKYVIENDGLEFYIIRGSVTINGAVFKEGCWQRYGATKNKTASKKLISLRPSPGAYILFKKNHLRHLT